NANRKKTRHEEDQHEIRDNRKHATGSKYKSRENNVKQSGKSLNRALIDIDKVFDKHQRRFNIDVRDSWRSKDFKSNKRNVLSNRHLAREWKIQTRLRERRILRKFKTNPNRITNMTFNAHRYLLSYRAMGSVRQSVKHCYM
ncbi:MAG: hypothetical protein ACPG2Y_03375, partial [Acholeplasmataceae bacterium]